MKDLQQLKKLSEQELREELLNTTKNLYELQLKVKAQQEKKNHLIGSMKKHIAHIQMLLHEKRSRSTSAVHARSKSTSAVHASSKPVVESTS